jgi:hypothetical protein
VKDKEKWEEVRAKQTSINNAGSFYSNVIEKPIELLETPERTISSQALRGRFND